MSPERYIMDVVTYALARQDGPLSWDRLDAFLDDPTALRAAACHERVDVPYRFDLAEWADCVDRGKHPEIREHLHALIQACRTDPEWAARAQRLWPDLNGMIGGSPHGSPRTKRKHDKPSRF